MIDSVLTAAELGVQLAEAEKRMFRVEDHDLEKELARQQHERDEHDRDLVRRWIVQRDVLGASEAELVNAVDLRPSAVQDLTWELQRAQRVFYQNGRWYRTDVFTDSNSCHRSARRYPNCGEGVEVERFDTKFSPRF